ncbi:hypothetical protein BMETH_6791364145996, partial [methanotrophic bacterial endosymbiont of Bathymodiolus sp.]
MIEDGCNVKKSVYGPVAYYKCMGVLIFNNVHS